MTNILALFLTIDEFFFFSITTIGDKFFSQLHFSQKIKCITLAKSMFHNSHKGKSIMRSKFILPAFLTLSMMASPLQGIQVWHIDDDDTDGSNTDGSHHATVKIFIDFGDTDHEFGLNFKKFKIKKGVTQKIINSLKENYNKEDLPRIGRVLFLNAEGSSDKLSILVDLYGKITEARLCDAKNMSIFDSEENDDSTDGELTPPPQRIGFPTT